MKETKKNKNLPDLRAFPEGEDKEGVPLFPINSTSSPIRVTVTVSIPSVSTGAVVINFHRLGQSQGQIIYSAAAATHPPARPLEAPYPGAWPIVMQIEVTPAASYRANFHRYLAGSS